MSTVALLKTVRGETVSIHSTVEAAQAIADRYNADPWVEPDSADTDAPYLVEVWAVQG